MEVAIPMLVAGAQMAKRAISRAFQRQDPAVEEEGESAEDVDPPPYEATRSTTTLPEYSSAPESSDQPAPDQTQPNGDVRA
jgi:hypothetical protein